MAPYHRQVGWRDGRRKNGRKPGAVVWKNYKGQKPDSLWWAKDKVMRESVIQTAVERAHNPNAKEDAKSITASVLKARQTWLTQSPLLAKHLNTIVGGILNGRTIRQVAAACGMKKSAASNRLYRLEGVARELFPDAVPRPRR